MRANCAPVGFQGPLAAPLVKGTASGLRPPLTIHPARSPLGQAGRISCRRIDQGLVLTLFLTNPNHAPVKLSGGFLSTCS